VPNPLTVSTTIRFAVPENAAFVRLAVLDVDGRRVRTLLDEARGPGLSAVNWDGNDAEGHAVASGVYFYRLETEGPHGDRLVETRRLLVVR
jgi:flagellar hook assembly protein FlgD